MSAIVSFYAGEGKDHRGRSLADYRAMGDRDMEKVHDYIQWMFPTRTASAFNTKAPVLTDEDVYTFRVSSELQKRMLDSYDQFREFLGLPSGNRKPSWVSPGNHNYLRITRVLECLDLLGLGDQSEQLRHDLCALVASFPVEIGDRAPGFWGIR